MNMGIILIAISILTAALVMTVEYKKEKKFNMTKTEAIKLQHQYRTNISRGIYMF